MNVGLLATVGQGYRIRIDEKKNCIFRGFHMGPSVKVIKENDTHIWVKCRSHYGHAGRTGMSVKLFCPTQYWKLLKKKAIGEDQTYDVVVEDAIAPGKKTTMLRAFLDEREKTISEMLAAFPS